MRRKLLVVISLLMISLSFFLGGCTKEVDKLKLEFDKTEISFTYGMSEPEEVLLNISNASENTDILFTETTKGVIDITKEYSEDNTWIKLTLTPKGAGSTRVIAYNATNSVVQTYINVNVYQQITDIYERAGVALYCEIGSKLVLSANSHFKVSPENANKADLVYEKIEEGSTTDAVVDRVTGVVDATSATQAGVLQVKVFPWYNEELSYILTIKVLKHLEYENVTVLRDDAAFDGKNIQLVKTKEQYATTKLVFAVSTVDNQPVEGTFVIKDSSIVSIQKTDLTEFYINSKELGETTITFYINIQGATSDSIQPLVYTYTIEVIDIPVDINVNGESAKGKTLSMVIYNIYGENTLGQELRFTLSPSSVISKYADVILYFPVEAQDKVALYYSNGSAVDLSTGSLTIQADTTLYIAALPTVTTGSISIKAQAAISTLYDSDDDLVETTLAFTIKQGLSKLMFDHQELLYMPAGESMTVNLAILEEEQDNADTSRISYSFVEDGSISISKINDLTYRIKAASATTKVIVFNSGNGHTATLSLIVYNPLTSLILETESIYENGSIGEKVYNGNLLAKVYVAVGTTFPVYAITNDGATVARVFRSVVSGSSINLNQSLVTVKSEGVSVYKVEITGYIPVVEDLDSHPEAEELEVTLSYQIEIEGYVPVSSISLSPLTATIYDSSSVGYYKIDTLAKLKLTAVVYPSSATNMNGIVWDVQGLEENFYNFDEIDENTRMFSAKNFLENSIEKATVTVIVSITDHNRTYTQKCVITVNLATRVEQISFSNVVGNTLTFDARKGLNTSVNSFEVKSNVYPVNATNTNLRYIVLDENKGKVTNATQVFTVTADGVVTPIKGGIGYLRVAAEDSFVSANDPTRYVDILVKVLDGKSEETAYTISNVSELRAIGNNIETMSLYYVLADNIDISQSEYKDGWDPIGRRETVETSLPFVGQLSGRYTRKVPSKDGLSFRTIVTDYAINNLVIKEVITTMVEEKSIGLFYAIGKSLDNEASENTNYYDGVPKLGTVKHLTIHVASFLVDVSQYAQKEGVEIIGDIAVYAGVIAGKNCENVSIAGCEGYGLINNSIKLDSFVYKVGAVDVAYIGAVVGINEGIISCTDESINTVSGADIIIQDKVNYGSSTFELHQLYYVGGITGYNLGKINGCLVEEDGKTAKFSTLYGKAGMMVVSNINSYGGIVDNRNNILSELARVGGVAGRNKGEIIGVATENEVYGLNTVGGIVGENEGTIKDCLVAGKVSGVYQLGGIAGLNYGVIENCNIENYEDNYRKGDSTASIIVDLPEFEVKGLDDEAFLGEIGGIAGRNEGEISFSYAITYMYKRQIAASKVDLGFYVGDILVKIPEGVDDIAVGGLVGSNAGTISSSHSSYAVYIVSPSGIAAGANSIGAFVGQMDSGDVVDSYTKGKVATYYVDGSGNEASTPIKEFAGKKNFNGTIKTSYAAFITDYASGECEAVIYDSTGAALAGQTQVQIQDKATLTSLGFNFTSKWLLPGDTSVNVEEVYGIKSDANHGYPILLKDGKILSAETPLNITITIEFNDLDNYINSTQILYFYNSKDKDDLKLLNQYNANIVKIADIISTKVFPELGKAQRFTITSSDTKILQVTSNGNLKIVGVGAVTLTVSSKLDSTIKQTISIYCTKPMNEFSLYKGSNTLSEASKIVGTDAKAGALTVRINQNTAITPKFGAVFEDAEKIISVEMNTNIGVKYIIDGSNGDPTQDFYFEGASVAGDGEEEATLTKVNFKLVDGNYECSIPYGQKTIITTTNAYVNRIYKVTAIPYIIVSEGENLIVELDKQKVVFNLNITRGATDIFFIGAQSAVISSGSSSTINVMLHSDDPEDEIVCTIYENNIIKNDLFVSEYLYGEETIHTAGEHNEYLIGFEELFRIELKEKNKLISEQHTYQIVFASKLTAKVKTTFTLVINAQDVTLISLENFSNGEIDYEGTTTGFNEYNKYEVATNKIIPGRTGIIKINTFPYFSYLDYVEVTGNDIHFEQVVKNEAIAETDYPYVYAGQYSTYLTNGIRLGNIYYDDTQNITNKIQIGLTGTYYAKTQLYSNVDEGTVITITVKAYKKVNGKPEVVCEYSQKFYVEYPPGVTLVYEGKTSKQSSDQLFLAVGTTSLLDIYVENSGSTDDVVLTSDNPYVNVTNKNGKGVIEVLSAAVNGTNVTINAKVIKVVGGVELERTDSITFTIVDYIIKDIGFENVKNNRMNKVFGKEYMLKISLANSTVIYDEKNENTKAKIERLFDNLSSTAYSTWYGYKAKNGEDRRFDSSGFETTYYRISVLTNSTTFLVKGMKFDTQVTDLKKIGATLKFYYNDTSKSWEFIKIGLNVDRSGYADSELYYHEGYSNGRYTFTINRLFTLDFYLSYSDENRTPIYNAQQFLEMKDNTDYILAEDIVLENFTGITTEIRSLDGNNKTITIANSLVPDQGDDNAEEGDEEESVGEELQIGLFQKIPEGGIYKNIRVVVENRLYVDAQNYKTVEFGLLAAENNGVVYNCSVEYVQSTSRGERADALVSTVVNGQERQYNYSYTTTYRYERYENADDAVASKIAAGERGLCVQVSVENVDGNMVDSSIGSLVGVNNGFITNSRVINGLPLHAYGNVGGLVAVNDGVISASYFNGKITNYSIVAEASSTGGLVAVNSGRINSSYTEGKYIPCEGTNGILIEVQATTSAAGFVYNNTGEIKNCYSNLRISSQAPTAGFVYINAGSIDTSYSTSLVQFNNLKSTAFVGVDAKNNSMNLEDASVTNSYYLDIDDNYPVKESYVSKIDSYEEFVDCDTYGNFAITEKELANSSDYVWNMSAVGVRRKPKLVSADKVIDLNMDVGTESNPYMVYSADTFNSLITLPVTGTVTQENDKYYTLVSDISFETSDLTAATYDMTFSGYIEGNGMNIENLRVSNTDSNTALTSIGLFSELKDAVVKNINVIPSEILGANISYVGGLAGKITTSKVFSISVKADDVVIQGKNFVGGLAGAVFGSNVQDITINVSTNSTYRTGTNEYYAFDRQLTKQATPLPEGEIAYEVGEIKYLSYLSYAGAVAGAALTHMYYDTQVRSVENTLKGLTISGQTKVIGEIVGSAVGYNGQGSTVKNVATLINEEQYLKANSVIGGIVGHNAGEIDFSYISHETEIQTEIDAELTKTLGSISAKAVVNYFRNLVIDEEYNSSRGFVIGGIVGINDGGSVRNSYSRVDIRNEQCLIAGGIIGNSSAGVIENCYASGSIKTSSPEVTQSSGDGGTITTTSYRFVGGIVGKVADGFVQHFVNKDPSIHCPLDGGNKLVVNSIIGSNNWHNQDASSMGYETIKDEDNNDVVSAVYTYKNSSGTDVHLAIPLTGGLFGAAQSDDCIKTDDKTLNVYNAYVFKSVLPGESAGNTEPTSSNSRIIAEIGGVSSELKDGDSTTSVAIDKTSKFSLPYDICKIVSNGKYVETATSSYYENFNRNGITTEGYKNYVFKMFLLTNFEFENLSDPYPKLKDIITRKYTSYVGNVNGATGNVYDEEALFGTVLKTSQGDAYEITSTYQLRCLAFIVNNNVIDTSNLSFTVTKDVTFSSDIFIPIGTYTSKETAGYGFKGRFLGNGYNISGMNYSNDYNYISLFGHTDGAYISDLSLNLSVVNSAFTVKSAYDIGAIVAYAKDTTITNSSAVLSATIDFSGSDLNKGALSIGGIVGYADGGKILKSFASAEIKVDYKSTGGKGLNLGGLAGVANNCEIKDCYSNPSKITHTLGTSAIDATKSPKTNVGGLIGSVKGSDISNTYAIVEITLKVGQINKLVYELTDEQLITNLKGGTITLSNTDVYKVLSAFETMGSGIGSAVNSRVYNSFFNGKLKNQSSATVYLYAANNFVKYSKNVTVSATTVNIERAVCANSNSAIYGVKNNVSTTDTKKLDWYSDSSWYDSDEHKWDFAANTGVWSLVTDSAGTVTKDYPVIETKIAEDGDVFNGRYGEYDNNTNTYLINTNEQLNNLATDISNGALRNGGLGYSFMLSPKEGDVVDYTLTNLTIGTFTNPFRGTFDGAGHVITVNYENTNVTTNTAVGVFGRCESAVITNLIIRGNIRAVSKTGILYVGSVVGLSKGSYINGIISNVSFNIEQQSIDHTYIGGMIGQSDNQVLTNTLYTLTKINKSLVMPDVASRVAAVVDATTCDALVAILNQDCVDNVVTENKISISKSLAFNHVKYGGIIGYIKNQSVLIKHNVTKASLNCLSGVPEYIGQMFGELIESGFGQENIASNRYSTTSIYTINGVNRAVGVFGAGDSTIYVEDYDNSSLEKTKTSSERYAGTFSDGNVTSSNFVSFFDSGDSIGVTEGTTEFKLSENIKVNDIALLRDGLNKSIPNMPVNFNGNSKTITFDKPESLTFINQIDKNITIKNVTFVYNGGFTMTDSASGLATALLVKNVANGVTLTLQNVKIVAKVTIEAGTNQTVGYGAIIGTNGGTINATGCEFVVDYVYTSGKNVEVAIGGAVGINNGTLTLSGLKTTGVINAVSVESANNCYLGGFVGKNAGSLTISGTSTSETEIKYTGLAKSKLATGNIIGMNIGGLTISGATTVNVGQDINARLYSGSKASVGGVVGAIEESSSTVSISTVYNTSPTGIKFNQTYQTPQEEVVGQVNVGSIIGASFDHDSVSLNTLVSVTMINVSAISEINVGGVAGFYSSGKTSSYSQTLQNYKCYTDITLSNRCVSGAVLNAGGIYGKLEVYSRSKGTNNSNGINLTHSSFTYSGTIDVSDFNSGNEGTYNSKLNIGSYAGCVESNNDGWAKLSLATLKLALTIETENSTTNKYKDLSVGLIGKAYLHILDGATATNNTMEIALSSVTTFIEVTNIDVTNMGYMFGYADIANSSAKVSASGTNILLAASEDNSKVYNGVGAGATSLSIPTSITKIVALGSVGSYTFTNVLSSISNDYNSEASLYIINNKAAARMYFILIKKGTITLASGKRVIFRNSAAEVAEQYVAENSLTGISGQLIAEKTYGYVVLTNN